MAHLKKGQIDEARTWFRKAVGSRSLSEKTRESNFIKELYEEANRRLGEQDPTGQGKPRSR